jgi:23S rRNA pseudouridine1911/1915/1917 synthase
MDVLYVDNHLLVVHKPHGLLSQADATGDEDVLTLGKAYVKQRFRKPGNVYLGLVHRIDRPASGVMVLARTSKAASRLSAQFRERTPSKEYLAVVEGHADFDGVLTDHLLKDERRHVHVVNESEAGAQRAESSATVLGRGAWAGRDASLVAISLRTGRSHQIRVQLAHRGHPIIGDMRYGATTEFDGRNLALHAFWLGLDHPTLRERMVWQAAPSALWSSAFGEQIEMALDAKIQAFGNE